MNKTDAPGRLMDFFSALLNCAMGAVLTGVEEEEELYDHGVSVRGGAAA